MKANGNISTDWKGHRIGFSGILIFKKCYHYNMHQMKRLPDEKVYLNKKNKLKIQV